MSHIEHNTKIEISENVEILNKDAHIFYECPLYLYRLRRSRA